MRYDDIERLAGAIAKSRLFGITTQDQAIALMMIAHAEGRHPALAARDYDIISGRPAKKAESMLRDFLDAGGKVEWHALSDEIADATFSHPAGGKARISWDMARAEKAGLAGKDMYKKFPRQMLRSRTVSEGVRTIWPTATSGLYVPEEAHDMATDDTNSNKTTLDHVPSPKMQQSPRLEAPAPVAYAVHTVSAASGPISFNNSAATPPPPNQQNDPPPPSSDDNDDTALWIANLRAKLAGAEYGTVLKISKLRTVTEALAHGPPEVQRIVNELLADAYEACAQRADEPVIENDPLSEVFPPQLRTPLV
jgi:hypothetical protein